MNQIKTFRGKALKQNNSSIQNTFGEGTLIGNRIPKDYFITKGKGESDITVHAGSYHLALRQAGIEMCNIVGYSSILPRIANEIERPDKLIHGSVMETISAVATCSKHEQATAGIIYGWLYDRNTGERYGGLVCEYNGELDEKSASNSLQLSLNQLYENGSSEPFHLRDINVVTNSIIPDKQYGTAIVAICFTSYIYPVIEISKLKKFRIK